MTTMALDNPAVVMGKLAAIENDLAEKQNPYEEAAGKVASMTRDFEMKRALAYARTKGSPNERKEQALTIVWMEDELFMQELAGAESSYAALRAVVGVLETRASICQSILRAHGRAG